MVVEIAESDAEDRLFGALADRTRRDIVARVMEREHSVSELADRYSMSFAAVQKHVAVLERAALVSKRAEGRRRLVRGNVAALHQAAALLERYEQIWRHRVAGIEAILNEQDEQGGRT